MDVPLVIAAALLGLAGTPHCAAMCGAACTAVTRQQGRSTRWAFHAARAVGYATAGAVAAASVGAVAGLGSLSPALRPLWGMLHAGALALGLWLLYTGRQPLWLRSMGRPGTRAAGQPVAAGWQRMQGPVRSGAAGAAWVGWPCGLLQSALVVAALANTPAGGAVVMAAFAAVTAVGLASGPWLFARLLPHGGAAAGVAWATRVAGALLAAASAWALGHALWLDWLAYCAT